MTTTTATPVTCPPSAVADAILHWDAVLPGDLFLIGDGLEQADCVSVEPLPDRPGDVVRITYRGHVIVRRPFDYTAVRRYTEG